MLVDLGESCMLDVVGEGIELDGQRKSLLGLGCHLGQGFLFAKPQPADAVSAFLRERRATGAEWVPPVDSEVRDAD